MRRVVIPSVISPPLSQDAAAKHIWTMNGQTMGTTWSLKLVPVDGITEATLQTKIQQTLDLIITHMSTWEPASHISRFNRSMVAGWHDLPASFFQVLSYALAVAEASDGAYDPTVGPLVNLWGFGPIENVGQYPNTAPTDRDIAKTKAICGWQQIKLDLLNKRAYQPGHCYLDLSAVAKGYGVDAVGRTLEKIGIHNYLVEIGGELRGNGMKPDGGPWWVTLEPPPGNHGLPETIIALHGLSIATSGDYRRYYEVADQRYAHSIDPRTGYPVTHGLVSVSVLHAECMCADALSTALTILGPDQGYAFAEKHNLAAHFVMRTDNEFTDRLSSALLVMTT